MLLEPLLYDDQGIHVMPQEIVTPEQTILVRDVRAVHIQRSGSAALDWSSLGLVLVLAATALLYAYVGYAEDSLRLLVLGGLACFLLLLGAPALLLLRKKVLVLVVKSGQEIPLALANSAARLERLDQAIRAALKMMGAARAHPRWGSAIQAAVKQTDSNW